MLSGDKPPTPEKQRGGSLRLYGVVNLRRNAASKTVAALCRGEVRGTTACLDGRVTDNIFLIVMIAQPYACLVHLWDIGLDYSSSHKHPTPKP